MPVPRGGDTKTSPKGNKNTKSRTLGQHPEEGGGQVGRWGGGIIKFKKTGLGEGPSKRARGKAEGGVLNKGALDQDNINKALHVETQIVTENFQELGARQATNRGPVGCYGGKNLNVKKNS